MSPFACRTGSRVQESQAQPGVAPRMFTLAPSSKARVFEIQMVAKFPKGKISESMEDAQNLEWQANKSASISSTLCLSLEEGADMSD